MLFLDSKDISYSVHYHSISFHLSVITHKFAEHTLRYCLIKQLTKEKCSILNTSKVHTHSF